MQTGCSRQVPPQCCTSIHIHHARVSRSPHRDSCPSSCHSMTCCTGAAARLPSPLRPLAQTPVFRSTTRSSLSALPPAFLAPRVHAQSFSVQHARLAEVPSSKKTAPNSAQKLRGTLRRLGLNSKWQPKPPGKAAADHKGSGHLSQRVADVAPRHCPTEANHPHASETRIADSAFEQKHFSTTSLVSFEIYPTKLRPPKGSRRRSMRRSTKPLLTLKVK